MCQPPTFLNCHNMEHSLASSYFERFHLHWRWMCQKKVCWRFLSTVGDIHQQFPITR
jgi:hypothetical protein